MHTRDKKGYCKGCLLRNAGEGELILDFVCSHRNGQGRLSWDFAPALEQRKVEDIEVSQM